MVSTFRQPSYFQPQRNGQHGQSVIIALLVLLLLAFVGALFTTIVARNLRNAGRTNRVLSADYYAESGIRYADDQLTYSLDGADWRPPLQNELDTAFLPPAGRALTRYNEARTRYALPTLASIKTDPDYEFLRRGFVRYNQGAGRFLLRVTYDPVGVSSEDKQQGSVLGTGPNARYLKIESVGREGTVDQTDPTTYRNAPPTRLAATLVSYKAIGITDYARFETNIDKRSDTMNLGVPSKYEPVQPNGSGVSTIITPGVFDFDGSATALRQYPVITQYGAIDAYKLINGSLVANPDAGSSNPAANAVPGGGSLHSNAPLRFYGLNLLYLNRAENPTDATGTPPTRQVSFEEQVEVAGDISLDGYQPASSLQTQNSAILLNRPANFNPDTLPAPTAADSPYVLPSTDPARPFDTKRGAVRDGGTGVNQTDSRNYPRNVNRLDPPVIDAVGSGSRLPRYRDIAKNSLSRVDPNSATASPNNLYPANAGQYGDGRAIYVDNSADVQPETSKLVGGYTLIDEWLNRAGVTPGAPLNQTKSGWRGDFYNPPGLTITFGMQRFLTSGGTVARHWGVRLTRSDINGDGTPNRWPNPDGSLTDAFVNPNGAITHPSTTKTIDYDDLYASNDLNADPTTLNGAAKTAFDANSNNDILIYVEGNVRVHGAVSQNSNSPNDSDDPSGANKRPRHITIVTNGTAYIEGNLLKGNPDSSITVLARDYVCVNTTQFLAGPQSDENPINTTTPTDSGSPDIHALSFSLDNSVLTQEVNFGLTGNATPSSAYNDLHLYVSGGPNTTGSVSAQFDLVNPVTELSINGNQEPFQNPVQTVAFSSTNSASQALFSRVTYDLSTLLGGVNSTDSVQLQIRRAPGQDASVTSGNPLPPDTADFLLERVAILPMDVRIEAVLYAQNRSFFVIPGPSFNSDSADNLDKYVGNATTGPQERPQLSGIASGAPGFDSLSRFPFYGQPIDMKIIVSGAVSEARPADISAQAAWMQRWGWIPQYHGSLLPNGASATEQAGHRTANRPSVGLTLIYDPQVGYPYAQQTRAIAYYLRYDPFGRPLPIAPKLPVCTGLLYSGQSGDRPILQ